MSAPRRRYRSRNRRGEPESVYFSNGKPGGRDDPLRRGLSGAGTRWYLRYLADGLKPEDARMKAENHRTLKSSNNSGRRDSARAPRRHGTDSMNGSSRRSPPRRSYGRRSVHGRQKLKGMYYDFIKDGCSPREARQRIEEYRRKNKRTQEEETRSDIRVAVLPKEYPNNALTLTDLTQIENLLIEELLNSKNTTKPQFNGIRRPAGFMLVDCDNEDTANWLKDIVPKIKWDGVELTTCRHADIPKCQAVTIRIPKSAGEDPEKILVLIQNQNAGIEATRWKVMKAQDEEDFLALRVIIDEKSYDAINANEGNIAYKFSKIRVGGLRNFVKESADVKVEKEVVENAEGDGKEIKVEAKDAPKNEAKDAPENEALAIETKETVVATTSAVDNDVNAEWGKWEDEEEVNGEEAKE